MWNKEGYIGCEGSIRNKKGFIGWEGGWEIRKDILNEKDDDK